MQNYYDELRKKQSPASTNQRGSSRQPGELGRNFYEEVWNWVSNHPDIRIYHHGEARRLPLSAFEALELQETGGNGAVARSNNPPQPTVASTANRPTRPSSTLTSFRSLLRQRLLAENRNGDSAPAQQSKGSPRPNQLHSIGEPVRASSVAHEPNYIEPGMRREGRGPRTIPKGIRAAVPIFDRPSDKITTPRLFASQNRTWQAITGHSIDLKKVPSMEFVLLSIIATRGPDGIAQPELVEVAQQDKRSVPKRTDELARKGYIEKKPVQVGRLRTSLLVHKKYIKEDHFTKEPQRIEDVFRSGRTFVLSGFVHVLAQFLKEVGVIPMRDLRRRMVRPLCG